MNSPEIYQKKVNTLLNNLHSIRRQYKEEKTSLKNTEVHLTNVEKAQEIVQQVAQIIQQKAHNQIVAVVDRCLELFFGGDYKFKIEFERKRGRTEARLVLLRDGNEVDDPLNAESGGVIDVTSFALRLSCLMLSKPKLRRIMILDEPFRNISREYQNGVGSLLKWLSEKFNIQFILVSNHIYKLDVGTEIRL